MEKHHHSDKKVKNEGLSLMVQLLFKRIEANTYLNLDSKAAKLISSNLVQYIVRKNKNNIEQAHTSFDRFMTLFLRLQDYPQLSKKI